MVSDSVLHEILNPLVNCYRNRGLAGIGALLIRVLIYRWIYLEVPTLNISALKTKKAWLQKSLKPGLPIPSIPFLPKSVKGTPLQEGRTLVCFSRRNIGLILGRSFIDVKEKRFTNCKHGSRSGGHLLIRFGETVNHSLNGSKENKIGFYEYEYILDSHYIS